MATSTKLKEFPEKGQWTDSALKILKERYLHTDEEGAQETPAEMFARVAAAIAQADLEYARAKDKALDVAAAVSATAKAFYDLMISGKFLPNSPTLMNAGLDNGLQYSACYVLPVDDSVESIFDSVKNAVIIHKSGGGTGFSFSRLRPQGSRVKTTGGISSGPISFMRVFDCATDVIKQGGRRRGANMGILRVDHPDIEKFITCKLDGGITNFNISVAITEDFMIALETDGCYCLYAQPGWPSLDGERYDGGEVVGLKNARRIFDKIVDAAWRSGVPGLVFIDRINEGLANPTPKLVKIEATNPCGETPLLPNEACNLGSINLSKFISRGGITGAQIDWESLVEAVRIATHFLDNAITVNPYPLPEIDKAVKDNRRIGLGVMGWADTLFSLGIPYNSDEALVLARRVMNRIQNAARSRSFELGSERGCFPNWEHSFYNWKDSVFENDGAMRNCAVTAIAPTGSISIIAGASSGIEPVFALAYRHIVKQPEGDDRVLTFVNPIFERTAKARGFWSEGLMAKVLERGSVRGLTEVPEDVRRVFVTAHEIEPSWHVHMQAAFQKYTDNGVSKTVNLPNNATRQDVEAAYLLAYETGCLGITVSRDGCKDTQVLHVGAQDDATVQPPHPLAAVGFEEKPPKLEPVKTPKVRPVNLSGTTYRKRTPVGVAYITVNDESVEPFEVFVNVGKAGSDVTADAEGLGRLISLILRQPGTLSTQERVQDIVGQLRGIGSGRVQGFGKHRVMSLADAVAQALAEHVGLQATGQFPGLPDVDEDAAVQEPRTGDLCPECGQATFVFEERCKKCYGCGYSEC